MKQSFPWLKYIGRVLFILLLLTLLASVVIANCSPRRGGHSALSYAVHTSRRIFTSQYQFQNCLEVDQDKNGTGEFGLLGELAGVLRRRDADSKITAEPCQIGYINKGLAPVQGQSYSRYWGYCFQVFLPHKDSVITDTGIAQNGTTDRASIRAQEQRFIVYAWPVRYSTGSNLCLAIDQTGELLVAQNVDTHGRPIYEGATRTPDWHAAMPKTAAVDSLKWPDIVKNSVGVDGQIWRGLSD